MRSGVSEGRSDVRVLKVLLFVTVFAGILTSLSLEISVSPSLVLSTVVLYSIYYIIVKYIEQKVVMCQEGRIEDGREEELRSVLHGGQGARCGWRAVDAALGARALDWAQAVQGSPRGATWDRNQPPRRQAQGAGGGGARPARHVASARGVERLRANGAWGVARAGDRGPPSVGGEALGRAACRGRPEGGMGRGSNAVGPRTGGYEQPLRDLRVPYRRRVVPPADKGQRGRAAGGSQTGLGPKSRPGHHRRR